MDMSHQSMSKRSGESDHKIVTFTAMGDEYTLKLKPNRYNADIEIENTQGPRIQEAKIDSNYGKYKSYKNNKLSHYFFLIKIFTWKIIVDILL